MPSSARHVFHESTETPPFCTRVMGIVNLTPDSFYDGGQWPTVADACAQAQRLSDEGVHALDLGAISTRPGALPITVGEELARLMPALEAIRAQTDLLISVDTQEPEVMEAALQAGADMINDVNALQAPGAVACVARHGAMACLMHKQGSPHTMQDAPQYTNVLEEVGAFFQERWQACVGAGIAADRLCVDPGFGFGKNMQHNLCLLGSLKQWVGRYPVLVGLSRKSMFQDLLGLPAEERLSATLAAQLWAVAQGVSWVRVHDAAPMVQALRVWQATHEAAHA